MDQRADWEHDQATERHMIETIAGINGLLNEGRVSVKTQIALSLALSELVAERSSLVRAWN